MFDQAHFKKIGKTPPPIVVKDVIVHPMQMAQALEKGAAATVLIACVVSGVYSCDSQDGIPVSRPIFEDILYTGFVRCIILLSSRRRLHTFGWISPVLAPPFMRESHLFMIDMWHAVGPGSKGLHGHSDDHGNRSYR